MGKRGKPYQNPECSMLSFNIVGFYVPKKLNNNQTIKIKTNIHTLLYVSITYVQQH